jgi:hypothetical protein
MEVCIDFPLRGISADFTIFDAPPNDRLSPPGNTLRHDFFDVFDTRLRDFSNKVLDSLTELVKFAVNNISP